MRRAIPGKYSHAKKMQVSLSPRPAIQRTFIAAVLVIGVLLGMVLSDLATYFRLPYGPYLVELVHEETRKSDFTCMRSATQLGLNISGANTTTLHQDQCAMVVSGIRNEDGSFDAYPGWDTWYGRWENLGRPVKIPAAEIKTADLLL